jgi:5'(3')-deoxyribonucleotidase
MEVKQLLIDMDNTSFNFNEAVSDDAMINPPEMYREGFFQNLKPYKSALYAIAALMRSGKYDVYICTKPLATSLISYTEKAKSIAKHFPMLLDKIIMIQDKSMINADILIDDCKKNIKDFKGEGILFNPKKPDESWDKVLKELL